MELVLTVRSGRTSRKLDLGSRASIKNSLGPHLAVSIRRVFESVTSTVFDGTRRDEAFFSVGLHHLPVVVALPAHVTAAREQVKENAIQTCT